MHMCVCLGDICTCLCLCMNLCAHDEVRGGYLHYSPTYPFEAGADTKAGALGLNV